jgi:hypothetical protein
MERSGTANAVEANRVAKLNVEHRVTGFRWNPMKRNHPFATLAALVLLSVAAIAAADAPEETYRFFREFVGLNEEQIAAIRSGKAIAKVIESRTPDEVFVFGSVYIEAAPESYLKLASDIDSLRKLPSYLAIRSFSNPPQLSDL